MKVVDCEKTIALLEMTKNFLPGHNGILPKKYLSKENMDAIIQFIYANAVDLDVVFADESEGKR